MQDALLNTRASGFVLRFDLRAKMAVQTERTT